ncbi:rhodanese-related sulfurtransferase [Pantoea sp. Nvir]|uniref:oxygen-dependent tRNA uridine(34) hydroxylase TrhO n=1 Tax=Pantoea sp. Nvir TaxID=2576760 RepID=UPI00135C6D27|nr:rhodanese-related sulfurtransferase [Pantoea sp. Nvir]CAJ0991522.1 hypothetical protein NVIRPANT_00304 [Pantoea sp. Nvir]
MPVLYNIVNNKELKARMLTEIEPRTTVSFYKYFYIADPKAFRDMLYLSLYELKVFGRIYVAHEGINAQISVPTKLYKKMKTFLYGFSPELDKLRMNIALDDGKSFWVLRLKVRDSIVADGIKDASFNAHNVGTYLKAAEVNAMLCDPDTVFVDMRNYYEYEVGRFDNAISIPANTFRDQLSMVVEMLQQQKQKKIVMYCTGGIRCEKASAWMRHNGFKKIYHIEGGIIEYVRRAREERLPVHFKGKNFVFDERMGERISNDVLSYCHQCGTPCDTHKNCFNDSCHSLFIQCSNCAVKYHKCCTVFCMDKLHLLSDKKDESSALC